MDTVSLIIAICVATSAIIGIGVCAILFHSRRNKDRKLHRQRTLSYEYEFPRERQLRENHLSDFSRAYRNQQEPRIRESPPAPEQAPPAYNNPINHSRRQQLPLFTPIRTLPSINHLQQASPTSAPTVHSAMPPSYAEIFLTPKMT